PQLTTLAAVYQRSRGAFNLLIRPWSEGGAAVRAERGGLRILTFCSAWAIVRRSRGGLLLRRRARKRRPHVGKVNHVDLSGDGVELAAKAELEAKRLQRVQRRASRNDGGRARRKDCRVAGRQETARLNLLLVIPVGDKGGGGRVLKLVEPDRRLPGGGPSP